MAVLLAGPRVVLNLGDGVPALWRRLDQGGAASMPTGDTPLDIPGLSGWWDAASPTFLQDATGASAGGWRLPVVAVGNRVHGGAALTHFSTVGAGRLPSAAARISGGLGGVGRIRDDPAIMARVLDQDQGFALPPGMFPLDAGWTCYLAWSRPAPRSGTGRDADPSVLLKDGTRVVLCVQEGPSGATLVLHPDSARVELAPLTRSHTHTVVLRYQPGGGVDVWLDDTKLASSCPLPPGDPGAGPSLLLHDGLPAGGAQCWFHEAAMWSCHLPDAAVTTVLRHARRWVRGRRRSIGLLFNGQSNAVNYTLNDGAARLLAEGVAWHLGALGYHIVASTGDPSAYTMQSGHGLYPAGAYPGSFLAPVQGASPATWPLGADGQALATALGALPAAWAGDIAAIIWPWNETDTLRDPGERQTFAAAARRLAALERAMLGKSAAELPLIWWSAIPYGTDGGMAMHRATVRELAAETALNVTVGNPQTADSNPRGAAWDSTTGAIEGGDTAHRDAEDNRRFARLAAPVVARAIAASGGADPATTLPADLPSYGGPRIRHVQRISATSLIVTVEHDHGTDLRIPRQAANGRGFTVTDGDLATGQGRLIDATGCERLDPTHLRITLSQPMANGAAACALHYPYGNRTIGRGNAVTDNHSERVLPVEWDIGDQLGAGWRLDYPLAATLEPIPLSDGPPA